MPENTFILREFNNFPEILLPAQILSYYAEKQILKFKSKSALKNTDFITVIGNKHYRYIQQYNHY